MQASSRSTSWSGCSRTLRFAAAGARLEYGRFARDELVGVDAARIVIVVDATAARAADARARAPRPARFGRGIGWVIDPCRAVAAALCGAAGALDRAAAAALRHRILIRRERVAFRFDHVARALDGGVELCVACRSLLLICHAARWCKNGPQARAVGWLAECFD